jgi:hypothetical protein
MERIIDHNAAGDEATPLIAMESEEATDNDDNTVEYISSDEEASQEY